MKVYVKAAVSIENLKTQFEDKLKEKTGEEDVQELFEQLVEVDPTASLSGNRGGKYCPWIFRRYLDGTLDEGDYQNLYDALENFAKRPANYAHTDLGQYKTVKEFLDDNERVGNLPMTEKEQKKMLKRQAHSAADQDKRLLATHDNWELWQPLTYAGSISLARWGGDKASWCTAYEGNDNYWRSYTGRGPLFIFINKDNPHEKYQTHFESNSYMYNMQDRAMGEDFFRKFLTDKPEFQEALQYYTVGGCTIRAGNLIGISNDDDTIDMSNLPVEVTNINSNLFRGKKNIKHIILPDSLTAIGDDVFRDCTSLESIVFPSHLESIGNEAFESCHGLKEVILPDSLTSVGQNCFCYCTGLTKAVLPDSLTAVGLGMFQCCLLLNDITLPDSITTIEPNAFLNCRALTSIKLPKSLQALGSHAFHSCLHLENIQMPKSLKEVGNAVFRGCVALSDKSKQSIEKVGEAIGKQIL